MRWLGRPRVEALPSFEELWTGDVEFDSTTSLGSSVGRFCLSIDREQIVVTMSGRPLGVLDRTKVRDWLHFPLATVVNDTLVLAGRGRTRTIAAGMSPPQDVPPDVVNRLKDVVCQPIVVGSRHQHSLSGAGSRHPRKENMTVAVTHPFTGRLEFELIRSIVPICTVDVVIRLDTVGFFIAMASIGVVDRAGLHDWLTDPNAVLVVDDMKFWVQSGHLNLSVGTSEPYVVADSFVEELRRKL